MWRGILEWDVLGLLIDGFIDDGIGVFDRFDVMNFLNFRFYKKLILLIVHYFINY